MRCRRETDKYVHTAASSLSYVLRLMKDIQAASCVLYLTSQEMRNRPFISPKQLPISLVLHHTDGLEERLFGGSVCIAPV